MSDTTRTVAGHVGYIQSAPNTGNLQADGRLIPQLGLGAARGSTSAPRIQLEVLGDDGRIVGSGATDDDGNYAIDCNFGQGATATPVRVRAIARSSLPFGLQMRVFPNASALEEYSYTSDRDGDPGDNRFVIMQVDVEIPLDSGSGAFHILDNLYEGFVLGRAGLTPGTILPHVNILWEPGNGAESRLTPGLNSAQLLIAGGIAGDDTSNTDVWDDPLLMRLVGQYLLDYFLWEVRPEGGANDAAMVPSAAWVEGFLDWFSCVARGSPIYWETVGSGAQGRVSRYFHIESFFDGALARLGPDDPNVYQAADVVGMASRFTIAEVLWDIHDRDTRAADNDNDGLEQDPAATLRLIDTFPAGFAYPYFYTLLDAYADSLTLNPGSINSVLTFPEDQQLSYPASAANGTVWPVPVSPGSPIRPPFSNSLSDEVDTLTPVPVNLEIGDETQRYFVFETVLTADISITLNTSGNLVVELLRSNNQPIEAGTGTIVALGQGAARFIVRVRPADGAAPEVADFDLDVDIQLP
ncbi:MAG: hypothetical protein ACYTEG_07460 [Planctomycetota bacterium]